MSKKDFPKKVTEDNIQHLREKAETIKKRAFQSRYTFAIAVPYTIAGLPVVVGSLFLVIWLLQNHYLDFLLWFSPQLQPIIFLVLLTTIMAVTSIPTLSLSLLLIIWLLRKYFRLPKYEETIFAECFIIARHLMNNDRMEAKKEVRTLLAFLTTFVRDWFNPKRKLYEPEFNLLRSGKSAICRMLMFSEEKIPELLMNFGLAFVRDDNPEAFSYLRQLVGKIREYGEPKGRFHRFLSLIEQYPHSFTLILSIVIFMTSLLFTIFGYRPPT